MSTEELFLGFFFHYIFKLHFLKITNPSYKTISFMIPNYWVFFPSHFTLLVSSFNSYKQVPFKLFSVSLSYE